MFLCVCFRFVRVFVFVFSLRLFARFCRFLFFNCFCGVCVFGCGRLVFFVFPIVIFIFFVFVLCVYCFLLVPFLIFGRGKRVRRRVFLCFARFFLWGAWEGGPTQTLKLRNLIKTLQLNTLLLSLSLTLAS